ncbi:MAG: hypothetical protein H7068_01020 [Pedobacter sp.]|nr:hypothetical protein [Chitinophagaceae bacterium]
MTSKLYEAASKLDEAQQTTTNYTVQKLDFFLIITLQNKLAELPPVLVQEVYWEHWV